MSVALGIGIAASLVCSVIASPLFGREDAPVANADGGDFSLDFVASAPFTYNHATGGGAFDDRTIGKTADVVESLEAGDFTCGDVVTYLIQIVVENDAVGTQAIRLTHRFTANTTGQPGAGHSQVLGVTINDPASVTAGDEGPATIDTGFAGALDSTIANVTTFVDPVGGAVLPTVPTTAEEIGVTFDVTNLEASDHVIVRIDTRLSCAVGQSPTGNLQAALDDAEVVGSGDAITSGSGNQTIPFKQFGSMPENTPTATNTATPTATNTATPTDTATNTATPTDTATNTPTPTDTATNTPTPTDTATNTPTPTDTATNTPTPTDTATNTPTPTDTATNTPTPTDTATNTPTPTDTATNTPTPTDTATNTPTPTDTATNTPTPTDTATNTPTPTDTATNTPTPTDTATNTPTPTDTATTTPTPTETATNTPTPTETATNTPTATSTNTPEPTTTRTSRTNTPTSTATAVPPSPTSTATPISVTLPAEATPTPPAAIVLPDAGAGDGRGNGSLPLVVLGLALVSASLIAGGIRMRKVRR